MNSFSNLIIAVTAQVPLEVLQHQFSQQAKMSTPQQLHELVRSHLPGLEIKALPVPPRQIPYNAGYVYFELVKRGPFWEKISTVGSIAMHVAGHFPELNMELWGIRD